MYMDGYILYELPSSYIPAISNQPFPIRAKVLSIVVLRIVNGMEGQLTLYQISPQLFLSF